MVGVGVGAWAGWVLEKGFLFHFSCFVSFDERDPLLYIQSGPEKNYSVLLEGVKRGKNQTGLLKNASGMRLVHENS